MTHAEAKTEHKHIYDTRLGILGLGTNNYPTAHQHNLAVAEADSHLARLKQQEWDLGLEQLRALRDSL